MNRLPSPSAAFWPSAQRIVLGHSIALLLLAAWLLELRSGSLDGPPVPGLLEILVAPPLAFALGLVIDAMSRWCLGSPLEGIEKTLFTVWRLSRKTKQRYDFDDLMLRIGRPEFGSYQRVVRELALHSEQLGPNDVSPGEDTGLGRFARHMALVALGLAGLCLLDLASDGVLHAFVTLGESASEDHSGGRVLAGVALWLAASAAALAASGQLRFEANARFLWTWDRCAPRPGREEPAGSFATPEEWAVAMLAKTTDPAPAPRASRAGVVEALFIATSAGDPMRSRQEVLAVAGQGLEGDRYARGEGTFSKPGAPGRHVTLIEAETIEAVEREFGVRLAPGEDRRNVTTRGVALNHLVGHEFQLGEVRLEGVRLCEPCDHLAGHTLKNVTRQLRHRGGLRARIVTGGIVRVGDAIE